MGPSSFGSEAEYAAFLGPRLRPGTRLVAVAGDRKGDSGPFLQHNYGPMCQVQWEGYGSASWVNWRDVALEVRRHLPTPPMRARTPKGGRAGGPHRRAQPCIRES